MGNHNLRPIKFRQSPADFPLTVSLGEKAPAWRLNRWDSGPSTGSGLRFVPPDDEGFTLRGDKRRLVYKGRRRSHRFTILGNNAFEYDVILEKEPESNVIALRMEGAEQFDFFRQPDFIKNPLLAGSYAVYKKEILLGEGTGKLCHIHRPEIIDARGRRCWGDLSVVGNELRITVPEMFLSEAAYPVVVDPTIGTTTVGSQTTGTDPDNSYYDRPILDNQIAVCKFAVPQNGSGLCTAYVYAYWDGSEDYLRPLLYSNENSKPYWRKSKNEQEINVTIYGNKTAGWRSNTFELDGGIVAGSYVWFGVLSSYFTTRFDYGGECYKLWPDYDLYPEYDGEIPPYLDITPYDAFMNIKYSWYFNYTATTAQNHVRTLTQGVTLTSALTQNKWTMLFRSIVEQVRGASGLSESRGLARSVTENVTASMEAERSQGFYRKAQEGVSNTDNYSFPVLFARSLTETAKAGDTVTLWRAYFRGLVEEAASVAEASICGAHYYRTQTETVQAADTAFRALMVFIKIFTTSFVRDFLIRRFLKSNEELVLKSCVCREIILDSTIH